jgi:hypothetical protein|tara:strand:- start:3032 stop:4009 length:978 start_codon:yes stop_codon:yes gene_type:complete
MKPRLVCVDETFLNGPSGHHLPLFRRFFDVSDYDATLTYDGSTTFMYRTDESRARLKKYEDSCKFIADGIWEVDFFCSTDFATNTLGLIAAGHNSNSRVMAVPKWFWFEEHFSQQDKRPLIKDMPFTHNKTKSFLMQIGDAKQARIQLYDALKQKDLLKNSLHSFLEYGIGLEGNFPKAEYDTNNPPFPQRAYRPEWYNDTHFTVVPEAMNKIIDGPNDCFITEKTMKPIMYGHPFIIYGDKGTYSRLRHWGFVTFPELFGESFEAREDLNKKIERMCELIQEYQHQDVADKILHNFNRFWNREKVEELMIKEMIEPMLEFISTK